MDKINPQGLFNCPVCKKIYNTKAREPIFMMCCGETVCKECVLIMVESNGRVEPQQERQDIERTFKCTLCSEVRHEKMLPLTVNKGILKKLVAFEHMIPVTCDEFPHSYISWYNRLTKKAVSFEAYMSKPAAMSQHVPIERSDIDNFFFNAREVLQAFTVKVGRTIEKINQLLSEELSLTGSTFLQLISEVKDLYSFVKSHNQEEEKKE